MPSHTVKQGECVSSIAFAQGLLPETIWDHPDNEVLRRKRGEDLDVLAPGDVLFIPDKRPQELACDTEIRHRFRRKSATKTLRICLTTHDGVVRANVPYLLDIEGALTTGETDGSGILSRTYFAGAQRGRLTYGPKDDRTEVELLLGHLDPIDTIRGIQARLQNLGFYFATPSGELDEPTVTALRAYQSKKKLRKTGEPDAATRASILEAHGD